MVSRKKNAPERPAYDVPLSEDDLVHLGQIVVILGQIDDDMTRSITGILGVDRPTANKIMRAQDPIDIWAGVLKGRCDDRDFDPALALAASETKGVQKDRNDFIHADYRPAFSFQGDWVTVRGNGLGGAEEWPGKVIASRSRDQKRRHVDELSELRNRAARASRLVAQVCHAVAPHGSWEGSPWFASVEPILAKSAGRSRRPTPTPTRVVTFDNVRPVIDPKEKG